jgi:ABC-type dipeptide/oligopeptide/nickel transport system ATPase component
MSSQDIILKVRHLCVSFESITGHATRAVDDVSFDLHRGRTLAIVGESGSGKSVTAYSTMQLIQPPGKITSGSIIIYPKDGAPVDITALHQRSPLLYKVRGGLIGMIFQEPMTALSPVIPVGKQVAEAALLHRPVTRKEAKALAIEMLGRVGIPDPESRYRQYSFQLSGGMRQRVVIAMALVARPQILIADEPTTALDVTIQAQILELIRELKEEFQSSVLFITHDLGVVAQVADEVMVMKKAQVMEEADVYSLYDNPMHPYTRRLLAAIPRLDADCARLTLDTGDIQDPPGLPPDFTLNPANAAGDPFMLDLKEGHRLRVWRKVTGGQKR